MECGRLLNGLVWSAYYSAQTERNPSSLSIEDVCASDERSAVKDNYLITYPDEDSDFASINKELFSDGLNDPSEPNRYANPLLIPSHMLRGISEEGNVEELMKNEAKKFEDYKFCEPVNDFDIELESEEAVPIVYLQTTRVAKLQRALRLAGLKKNDKLFVSQRPFTKISPLTLKP
ncbi:unnamed protein product [Danaus chrysippus]|uniref:(African queen) hypothetical protein n=1 Tax=Danaus chrysippus TaxID=151541 RepID=A0A8J2R5Y1_9NEOP|nr:unnamed protein product [Danaus chrysippus]